MTNSGDGGEAHGELISYVSKECGLPPWQELVIRRILDGGQPPALLRPRKSVVEHGALDALRYAYEQLAVGS